MTIAQNADIGGRGKDGAGFTITDGDPAHLAESK